MRAPSDLTVFLAHVAAAYPLLGSHAALARVAREAVEDAAADGCTYLELRFGPLTHARPGFAVRCRDRGGMRRCGRRARAAGIAAGVVVCALRHHDEESNIGLARAAAARAGDGVVGFDVAGDELLFPDLAPYVRPFECAAAAGLGLTAHVAEAGPAGNVREAHEMLGVRRIGHGTRLGADADALAWSVEHGMCLEVCVRDVERAHGRGQVGRNAPDSPLPRCRMRRRARRRQSDHDRHDARARGGAAPGCGPDHGRARADPGDRDRARVL